MGPFRKMLEGGEDGDEGSWLARQAQPLMNQLKEEFEIRAAKLREEFEPVIRQATEAQQELKAEMKKLGKLVAEQNEIQEAQLKVLKKLARQLEKDDDEEDEDED